MNDESLRRANGLLAAIAGGTPVGSVWNGSLAELGRAADLGEPLAVARAMRALLSRGRLEAVGDGYRLVDDHPVAVGERGSVPPRERPARATRPAPAAQGAPSSYGEVGREAIDRLIELGKEVATLRAELRGAKEEVRVARVARIEAEQRAEGFAARIRELESRAEMAEVNLRTLLATARGPGRDGPVATNEMEAILGVLKGDREGEREASA